MVHIPVLVDKVIEFMIKKDSRQLIIDATAGEGGHLEKMIESSNINSYFIGIEWDVDLVKKLKDKFKPLSKRVEIIQGNFKEVLSKFLISYKEKVNGILFDLGLNMFHIKECGRGFTFMKDEPLDMRYSQEDNDITAYKIVNYFNFNELVEIFRKYGEEFHSKKVARAIIEYRKKKPIKTTRQLVSIIEDVIPSRPRHIHPATKIFQALRIKVNKELDNLEEALKYAIELLNSGGRLVVISYHSLEDRIVKNFFKKVSNLNLENAISDVKRFRILTKKPIRPEREEIKFNPSSRSAKLRVIERI